MILSKTYNHGGKIFKVENYIILPENELEELLQWRNSDQVRLNMNNSDIISLDDHFRYITLLKKRNDKAYFRVMEDQGEKIGAVYFDQIENGSAFLGIFTNPYCKVKTKGTTLMHLLEKIAFQEMKLEALFLEVKSSNKRAVELYKRFNYNTIEKHEVITALYVI